MEIKFSNYAKNYLFIATLLYMSVNLSIAVHGGSEAPAKKDLAEAMLDLSEWEDESDCGRCDDKDDYEVLEDCSFVGDVCLEKRTVSAKVDCTQGNIDGQGAGLDVADLTTLASFLFGDGAALPCEQSANVFHGNESLGVDVFDLCYLVVQLFHTFDFEAGHVNQTVTAGP